MQESAETPAVDMTARDRHVRRRMNAATRLLIERSWALLQQNPTGLAHFRSRNYKARVSSPGTGRMFHGT